MEQHSIESADGSTLAILPALQPFLCSRAQFLAQRPYLDALLGGAIVFRSSPTAGKGVEALIIRRAPSDSYPLLWEHPSGSVSTKDQTLVHAALREFQEETGLAVRGILGPVALQKGSSPVKEEVQDDDENATMDSDNAVVVFNCEGRVWGKLVLLVDVEEGEVRLDPSEHDRYAWVTEDEVEQARVQGQLGEPVRFVSEGVRRTILGGFRLFSSSVP